MIVLNDGITSRMLLGDLLPLKLLNAAGLMAATETADGAAFVGGIFASGTLAAVEAADTATIVGTVQSVATGTLDATEAPDTAAFTGQLAAISTGVLAATEQGDGAAFTGHAAALGHITQKYSVIARQTVPPHLVAQRRATSIVARRSTANRKARA